MPEPTPSTLPARKTRFWQRWSIGSVLLVSSLLLACGLPVEATQTGPGLVNPTPTVTATLPPTATALPPTRTPTTTVRPTNTPAPTATTQPLPSPTKGPPTPTRGATTPTPRAVATATKSGGTASGNMVVRDEDGICQLTILPGYTVDNAGDGFDANDNMGIGVLTSATGRTESPAELAETLYDGVTAALDNPKKGKVTPGTNSSQIDFTAELQGQPGKGTVFAKKFGTTACGLSIFTFDGAAIPHEAVVAAILPTVKENK